MTQDLQGNMLGYLFFSLFSSLFAISRVPCMYPGGNDYRESKVCKFKTTSYKKYNQT